MSRKDRTWWLIVAVVLAALDLWTKSLWTYPEVGRGTEIKKVLIENWLAMEPVYNVGGVWSLPIPSVILLVATLLAVPLIAGWIFFPVRSSKVETFAKTLVLSGAIGNGYDRIVFGKVRDFINVYYGDFAGSHWPTFNVADSALVTGIGLLLILSFKHPAGAQTALSEAGTTRST